ncbi:MAG: glycogen debranching protein GlgX [Desulforhopalus sp.]
MSELIDYYQTIVSIITMSTTKRANIRKRGYPLPGGVTRLEEGINFAIFSRHATRVTLVIDHWPKGATLPARLEFELDPNENRTGDMWHILLATHQQNFSYGYRIDGPSTQEIQGVRYDYEKILIDPYSRALLPRAWGEPALYGQKPCCRIVTQDFDWQNDRPLKTPLSKTIIYELHIRGFTRDTSSGVASPGTYLGIIEKIPYLKSLGITAVELMPVTEFDENDIIFHNSDTGKRLTNFWGYNPVSFFAVNSGYAEDPTRVINEFKTMVLALHQAGIEVFLDMVYNHTGEGGYDGNTCSFRGIDNPIYYLLDAENNYLNFSGCGNTINCNHPVVRHLIRDSLRYWVTEMHIDGFRFDLASILGRDQQGHVLPNPPMIEAIGEDPVLRDTKMIAEAWDAAGLYQVGSFSNDPRWAEWNGRFRDDVRSFMVGNDNTITNLATRIAGSSDLYQSSGRGPLCSINFLTSHDGFTLRDLVSFNQKYNRANGEQNRDGENHNISWNSGQEGLTVPVAIEQLRLRRMKTFTVLLFLSQGVPMICAGDEFGRTQNGNNNAWCQDNQTSWLDWSLLEKNKDFHLFFKKCIELRQQHVVFRRENFFQPIDEPLQKNLSPEIDWQYLIPGEENWKPDCHGLAFLLRSKTGEEASSDFFVMLNGDRNKTLYFSSPEPQEASRAWYRIIDTAADSPGDFLTLVDAAPHSTNNCISVPPFGCVVLQSDF